MRNLAKQIYTSTLVVFGSVALLVFSYILERIIPQSPTIKLGNADATNTPTDHDGFSNPDSSGQGCCSGSATGDTNSNSATSTGSSCSPGSTAGAAEVGGNSGVGGGTGDGGGTSGSEGCAEGCGSGGEGCFGAGTQILMADSSTKSIEDIIEGDVVMAFEGMGPLTPHRVVAIKQHKDHEVVKLNNLIVTLNHPFLTPNEQFVELRNIKEGSELVGQNGNLVSEWRIEKLDNPETVYNFTVETAHTYIAGGYRVHNKL